jgi:hypothetical protein
MQQLRSVADKYRIGNFVHRIETMSKELDIDMEDDFQNTHGGDIIIVENFDEDTLAIPIMEANIINFKKENWDSLDICDHYLIVFVATNNSGGPLILIPMHLAANSNYTILNNIARNFIVAANEIRIDENTLRITRFNIVKNQNDTRDLQITNEQWEKYVRGALIQNAFPHLTANEREFIITGIYDDEDWDAATAYDDEEF